MNRELGIRKATLFFIILLYVINFIVSKIISSIIGNLVSVSDSLLLAGISSVIMSVISMYLTCIIVGMLISKRWYIKIENQNKILKNTISIMVIITMIYQINFVTFSSQYDSLSYSIQQYYFYELKHEYNLDYDKQKNDNSIDIYSFFRNRSQEELDYFSDIKDNALNFIFVGNIAFYYILLLGQIVRILTVYYSKDKLFKRNNKKIINSEYKT